MPESGNPVLTFVVVNRNTADLLIRCLDFIFSSELTETLQVILVDNGSTDDSVSRVKGAYPGVEIIEAGRNLGFAAANNRAFEKATGRYLILVNTDALLERHCAAKLLALMESNPRVGMAGPQLLNQDGSLQTSYEAVPTLATETLNRSLLKRLFPKRFPGKATRLSGPEPVEALIGAVMIIRRKALEELGGFDEGYFFFLEETDLAVRMRKAGWGVMHEPAAVATHLQGATAKTYQAGARIEFYRSRYLFFEKHYGIAAMRFLRAVIVANLTLNAVALGLANLFTLGKSRGIAGNFRVRTQLWKWHLEGCPAGPGLPRE
ncbi:MAG: glycosyltransferase family 2 protein [Desulfomonile tiedjei]|uniref:Glycosyltransferase family 2 protein n=1 Tax=Desulfomonile tiedjei TaxID=2358 RepID=A0A9D6UZG1_9BACT|nr:glycosyltransferase family 2 protein [Desulfomonile tiedjei]